MADTPTPTLPVPTRPPVRRRAALVVVALVAALGLLAGCGSDSDSGSGATTTTAAESQVTGTVTVFGAASLKDAFTKAAEAFEEANPDADVTLNFGASSALAQQINEGAPADVFASADEANMQKV